MPANDKRLCIPQSENSRIFHHFPNTAKSDRSKCLQFSVLGFTRGAWEGVGESGCFMPQLKGNTRVSERIPPGRGPGCPQTHCLSRNRSGNEAILIKNVDSAQFILYWEV